MRNAVFAFAIVLSVISCDKESEQIVQISYPVFSTDASDSIVIIETKIKIDDGWGIVRGNGIVIRHNGKIYIYTAAHVIKDTREQEVEWIKVYFPNKTDAVEAKLVGWNLPYNPDKTFWTIRFENGKIKELINPSFDEVLQAIILGRSAVVEIRKGPLPGFDIALLEVME